MPVEYLQAGHSHFLQLSYLLTVHSCLAIVFDTLYKSVQLISFLS